MPTEPDRPQPPARQWTAVRSAAALRAIGRAARIATESVGIRMAPGTAAIERVAAAAQAAVRRRTGRQPGTKHYRAGDDDIFAADVERAVRACIEAGERVGNRTVAAKMGCDRETLAGWLKDFPRVHLKSIETKIRAERILPA